jgi:GT2 family glycosyltransferase
MALYRVARVAIDVAPDMLYSDEAIMDEANKKLLYLLFRPGFSLEYLRSHPYIVHLVAFQREFLQKLGGFDESLSISQDYDLILRAAEQAHSIVHIPEVLYRWRTHAKSVGHEKKQSVMQTSLGVLQRHLARSANDAYVEESSHFNFFDVRYPLRSDIKVAIVIPTKNHGDLVRQCIDSIKRTVKKIIFEIILVDHDSTDPVSLEYFREVARQHCVLRYRGIFNFSAINNFAISQLDDSYTHYLFCNNDIEAIEEGWLERMLELGQQDDVGVVGAKLLYPDREKIQHAGVLIGMNKMAGHIAQFMNTRGAGGKSEPGYMGRLICVHEQMAMTAACMLVSRAAFKSVKGYDEDLAVGFGDTDLCLKIFHSGYRVLFCPHAELVHHESYTRGKSAHDPHPEDSARFRKKWQSLLQDGDFYYNPGLSVNSSFWDMGDPPGGGMHPKVRIWRKSEKPCGPFVEWH